MVNTNLWTRPTQRVIGGWPEKRQKSQPSVKSPVRDGMSGRTANVKPGPAPPPQGPDGRFQGTCVPGHLGNGE